jgi:hypothetical protein
MANDFFCEQEQTARASAALPAAGAYDAAPTEMHCVGFETCALFISYTRAGVGGDMQFRVEVSPDSTGAVWHRSSLYAPGAVASGADSVSNLQREDVEYGSTAAGLEAVMYGPFDLRGASRMRVPCCESGAVGTPGTAAIEARFA